MMHHGLLTDLKEQDSKLVHRSSSVVKRNQNNKPSRGMESLFRTLSGHFNILDRKSWHSESASVAAIASMRSSENIEAAINGGDDNHHHLRDNYNKFHFGASPSLGTSADVLYEQLANLGQNDRQYVQIGCTSYHWTVFVGKRISFKTSDISKYPLLQKALNRRFTGNFESCYDRTATTGEGIEVQSDSMKGLYVSAAIVHRMCGSRGSDRVVWSFPLPLETMMTVDDDDMDECTVANGKMKAYIELAYPELITGDLYELIDEVHTYQFSRTRPDGKLEYGYCIRRYIENDHLPTVFCILSDQSAYSLYDALLVETVQRYKVDRDDAFAFLQAMHDKPIPVFGGTISFPLRGDRLFAYCWPAQEDLWIEDIGCLLTNFSISVIIDLLCAVLLSCNVVCFSSQLCKLTRCVRGIACLMYPFQWPYQLALIVPNNWASDCLDVPSPFIYGFVASLSEFVCAKKVPNTVFANIERNSIQMQKDHMRAGVSDGSSGCDALLEGDAVSLNLRTAFPDAYLRSLNDRLSHLTRFRFHDYEERVKGLLASEAIIMFFTDLLKDLPRAIEIASSYRTNVVQKMSKVTCLSNYTDQTHVGEQHVGEDHVGEEHVGEDHVDEGHIEEKHAGEANIGPGHVEERHIEDQSNEINEAITTERRSRDNTININNSINSEDVRKVMLSYLNPDDIKYEFIDVFTRSMIFTSFIETDQWKRPNSKKFFRRIDEKESDEHRDEILHQPDYANSLVHFQRQCTDVEKCAQFLKFK